MKKKIISILALVAVITLFPSTQGFSANEGGPWEYAVPVITPSPTYEVVWNYMKTKEVSQQAEISRFNCPIYFDKLSV